MLTHTQTYKIRNIYIRYIIINHLIANIEMKIDTNKDEHLAFINDNTFTEIVWMKYS